MFGASPLTGYCKRQRPALPGKPAKCRLTLSRTKREIRAYVAEGFPRLGRSLVPSRFGLNPLRRNPAQSIEEDDSTALTFKYLVVK